MLYTVVMRKSQISEDVKIVVYPILTEMASRIELELIAYGEDRLNKLQRFRFPNLEQKGFILGDVSLSLQAVKPNISDKFQLHLWYIEKIPDAKWSDFLTELNRARISFKPAQKPAGVVTTTTIIYKDKYGNFSRSQASRKLTVNFNPTRKKGKLIKLLCESTNSMSTDQLVGLINFPTKTAARKAVGEINSKLKTGLQLGDNKMKFIIHDPGSGYRLNPMIEIVAI